jgi:hypothetical protein
VFKRLIYIIHTLELNLFDVPSMQTTRFLLWIPDDDISSI